MYIIGYSWVCVLYLFKVTAVTGKEDGAFVSSFMPEFKSNTDGSPYKAHM